jgi:hypothetical protein
VTWDNIIIPPDENELGWKETVRISPLEDTIVALRPVIPALPFELPNSIRLLSPMMPNGATLDGPLATPAGAGVTVANHLVNFGWEYVYHCHILSHEEMDMMRPVLVALPPVKPDGLSAVLTNKKLYLTWNDNSIAETAYVVQRSTNGGAWVNLATIQSPLDLPNTTGVSTYIDTTYKSNSNYQYRILAQNTVGYLGAGGAYMNKTVSSVSDVLSQGGTTVLAPLTQSATKTPIVLSWSYTPAGAPATGFRIQRATNATFTTGLTTFNVGLVSTYSDGSVKAGVTYYYRVAPTGILGVGPWSNVQSKISL